MKIFPRGKNVPLAKKFCKNVPLAKNVSKNAKLFLPHSILLHHCVCLYSFLNRRVNFIPCTYYCTYTVYIRCTTPDFFEKFVRKCFCFLGSVIVLFVSPPDRNHSVYAHFFAHVHCLLISSHHHQTVNRSNTWNKTLFFRKKWNIQMFKKTMFRFFNFLRTNCPICFKNCPVNYEN